MSRRKVRIKVTRYLSDTARPSVPYRESWNENECWHSQHIFCIILLALRGIIKTRSTMFHTC